MFKKIFVLTVSKEKQIEHLNARHDDVNSAKAINKDFSYQKAKNVIEIENNLSKEELFKKVDEELSNKD